MNVKEIVQEWIRGEDKDGLWNPEIPCGCGLDDLAPCGDIKAECEAALASKCKNCGNEWYYCKKQIILTCDMCRVRTKGGVPKWEKTASSSHTFSV